MVDTFSTQRNKSENIINKVVNFAINDIGNYSINEVEIFKINDVRNFIINKVAKLIVNYVGNYSNRANVRYVKVQFAVDSGGIFHQNLLSGRMIGNIQEEDLVLVPPTEPIIVANNQPTMTVRNGVIMMPQVLKTSTMPEFIRVTTPYKTVENSTPRRVRRTNTDGSTSNVSVIVIIDVASCTSPTPPSVCICNISICKYRADCYPKPQGNQ